MQCMSFATASMVFALLCHNPLVAQEASERPPPLSVHERAVQTLSRLTFGARPGDLSRTRALGFERWLKQQLAPESIPDKDLDRRLANFATLALSCNELVRTHRLPQDAKATPEQRKRARELRTLPARELQQATFLRAVYSERQLYEVMCNFWRNHFNVSLNKNEVGFLATAYERDVVRAHCFGRFEDMLLASAKHPAMLIYLDNVLSQKPLTRDEQKALERAAGAPKLPQYLEKLQRERGLNENYARELLELHTLGVDNGYTQRDVIELARVLTGWTVSRGPNGDFTFAFRKRNHDPGTKRLLGWRFNAKQGVDAGIRAIRKLARHKNTASFIARKLCIYLITDTPSDELVDRIAKVFLATKGDLKAVTKAVVTDPAFFDRANYQSKFRTPLEATVAMVRVLDADVRNPQRLCNMLKLMRQPIYQCDDPTGYYDSAEAWLDPGALAVRWASALELAGGRGVGLRVANEPFGRAPSDAAYQRWLANQVIPSGLGSTTRAAIDRRAVVTPAPSQRELLGLLLGSPEFQRQ